MHSDIHHRLHTLRAGEPHTATAAGHRAAAVHRPRAGVRTMVGWKTVETGLRLTQNRPRPAAARAPRPA